MELLIVLAIILVVDIVCIVDTDWSDKDWWGVNKKYDVTTWTRDDLMKFTPYEFELFCGNLMKKLGYKVINTSQTKDEGKDIIVIKNGIKTYVECKQFDDSTVGRPLLQKLVGSAYADNVESVLFITTSLYTQDACDWMCKINKNTNMNFDIWDCDDLLKLANKAFQCESKEYIEDTVVLDIKQG